MDDSLDLVDESSSPEATVLECTLPDHGAHLDTTTGAPTSGPARPRQRPIKAGSETGAPLRVIPLVAVSRCAP